MACSSGSGDISQKMIINQRQTIRQYNGLILIHACLPLSNDSVCECTELCKKKRKVTSENKRVRERGV